MKRTTLLSASIALLAFLALASFCQAQTNRPSGSVVMWGGSSSYGLMDVPVAAQGGVVAIAAGGNHILALKSDGSVVAWGRSTEGQTAVPVAAKTGVVAIAAGGRTGVGHSVALKSNGSVVAWGSNQYGQLNLPVAARSGVVAVAAGDLHTVALKGDGTVVAWGDNLYGEVNGIAPTALPRFAVASPVTLGGQVLSGVVAIAAGTAITVALRSDGSVVAWGNNYYGQRNVPYAARSGVVAIAAGGYHTVALKSDGSVLAWGSNNNGQTDVPVAAQSGVVAIAAGLYHTMALKDDGSIVLWGWYPWGLPTDLPSALAITTGTGFAAALVQEPASLTLHRNADETLSLSWSGAGVLEQTESLTSPNWQPTPSQDSPQTLSTTNLMQFFRVKGN